MCFLTSKWIHMPAHKHAFMTNLYIPYLYFSHLLNQTTTINLKGRSMIVCLLWMHIYPSIHCTSDALAPFSGNSCSGMVIKKLNKLLTVGKCLSSSTIPKVLKIIRFLRCNPLLSVSFHKISIVGFYFCCGYSSSGHMYRNKTYYATALSTTLIPWFVPYILRLMS